MPETSRRRLSSLTLCSAIGLTLGALPFTLQEGGYVLNTKPPQEPANASKRAIDDAWKKQRTFPDDIEKITVKITLSRHRVGNYDFFTNKEVAFNSTVDDPRICNKIARKIHGTRGPSFGEHYWSGPPDAIFGTVTVFSKSTDQTLEIIVTNSGFYLGEEIDLRRKFHSWYLAKIVNDVALKNGTSLRQRSFNTLSGISWVVRDQYELVEFDKREYQDRAADVWNFLPDEVVTFGKEQMKDKQE